MWWYVTAPPPPRAPASPLWCADPLGTRSSEPRAFGAGLLGALFNKIVVSLNHWRMEHINKPSMPHRRVMEVVVAVLVTGTAASSACTALPRGGGGETVPAAPWLLATLPNVVAAACRPSSSRWPLIARRRAKLCSSVTLMAACQGCPPLHTHTHPPPPSPHPTLPHARARHHDEPGDPPTWRLPPRPNHQQQQPPRPCTHYKTLKT